MWYPNKAQWVVIWLVAAAVTIIALNSSGPSNPGNLVWALIMDGVLLVWWFQRRGSSN